MTLDHKQRRLRHKIHLFVSFLGLLLRETDQKRVIYVNLKKNGENDHFCAPVHATGLRYRQHRVVSVTITFEDLDQGFGNYGTPSEKLGKKLLESMKTVTRQNIYVNMALLEDI